MADPFLVLKILNPLCHHLPSRPARVLLIFLFLLSVQTKDPSIEDIDDIDWTSEDEREIEDIPAVQAAAAKIEVKPKRI